MKKILIILGASSLILLLFTHPGTAASGCSLGLRLWYTAVLPSLLPFLIFSNLMVATGLFRCLTPVCAPLLKGLFGISDDSCYSVLLGFLCGLTMGAKVVADLVREGHISPEEGSYLLGFCNNVSPAFFLNYICLTKLGYASVPWLLVLLFYALPLIYGMITRPFYHFHIQSAEKKQASLHRLDFPMLDACMMDAFSTITRLGGYIILFTILVQFLKLLPLPPFPLAFLSILMEISCGIDQIAALTALSPLSRTALVCTGAALGGLCICAQTQSVLSGTPLRVGTWLKGRITIAVLVFLLVQLAAAAPALRGCW